MSASLPPSRDDNPLSANPDLHGQVIYYNTRFRVLDGQMTKALAVVGAVMVALMASRPATAAPEPAASDLAAIQQQLSALRADYNARITELETRLKAAEDRAARAEAVSQPASQTASAPPPTQIAEQAAPGEVVIADNAGAAEPAKTSSANAMNPGVSVVLNGNYVADSRNPDSARIAGYPMGSDGHPLQRGFSLDESEVTLAANVDPFLTANLTVSFGGDNQASVEEAFVQSTSLPGGLTLRAGRFYSAIGYLNERHAHNWTFIDMPLPYRALLGRQFGDDGVQARWLAPTPFFLEIGGELFRGDRFPAANADKNRAGAQTLFLHTGSDINSSSSWLAALSYLHTEAHARVTGDLATGLDTFDGSDTLGIASLVYKWAPGGNPVNQNLVLSAEYFLDRQAGRFNSILTARDPRGWYAQGVFQFAPHWSAGLRYAALDQQGLAQGLGGSGFDPLGHAPSSVSGLFEYDSSEFGRFRLELSHDMSDLRANDQAMFQYTVVYGPHGAHRD